MTYGQGSFADFPERTWRAAPNEPTAPRRAAPNEPNFPERTRWALLKNPDLMNNL
jgi:hypothetical protein